MTQAPHVLSRTGHPVAPARAKPKRRAERPRGGRTAGDGSEQVPAGRGDGPSLVSVVANTLFTIALLGVAAGILGSALGLYRLDVVMSGSMKPTYDPGDMVVATKTPADRLGSGDVVMFRTPDKYGAETVTHRVVSVEMSEVGVVTIRTKGDNNEDVDPWQAQITTEDVWVVRHAIPNVGFMATWAKTWWPLLIAAALAMPMISVARSRIRESWAERSARRALGMLWLVPAVIVLGTGGWVAAKGAAVVDKISADARSWQGQHDANPATLLNQFDVHLVADPSQGPTALNVEMDDPTVLVADGEVGKILDLTRADIGADTHVVMDTKAATTNALTKAVHVSIETCTGAWSTGPGGFACDGESRVLVGDAPLVDSTISVLDGRGEMDPGPSTHLLLRMRTSEDVAPSAATQSASLAIRLDAK